MVAVSRVNKAFFALGFDSIDLHGLANPHFARPEASGIEFFGHPSPAILLANFSVYGPDLSQKSLLAQAFEPRHMA